MAHNTLSSLLVCCPLYLPVSTECCAIYRQVSYRSRRLRSAATGDAHSETIDCISIQLAGRVERTSPTFVHSIPELYAGISVGSRPRFNSSQTPPALVCRRLFSSEFAHSAGAVTRSSYTAGELDIVCCVLFSQAHCCNAMRTRRFPFQSIPSNRALITTSA